MHTNTFCKYRKKLLASPRVHLVLKYTGTVTTFVHSYGNYAAYHVFNCTYSTLVYM